MAIFETLTARPGFTDTDDTLANFVLTQPDSVIRMGASELASAAHTSPAAVTRFCKRVGYSSFREFRVDLHSELEWRRASAEVGANVFVNAGQSSTVTVDNMRRLFEKAAADTAASISAVELRNAAGAVRRAGKVLLYGVGDSAIACEQFGDDLLRIGITPVLANRHSMLMPHTLLARRYDVGLFVSYSGLPLDDLADQMGVIRDVGGSVIIVTARACDDILRKRCDYHLQLPTGERRVESVGTLYSRVCIQFALSSLYATTYAIDAKGNDARRDEAAASWLK